MSAVFSFGGTTEEICLRRWPERGRKCKENTPAKRVRAKKRVHFLLFPNLNSTLQVLTLVKNGMKAHMIQTLPNEKKWEVLSTVHFGNVRIAQGHY